MGTETKISLERIRTDGWFERLSESIGSFHTLCDVLGERFFAFALIVGARVSSLMIDRFNPDQSLVEFSFGELDDNQDEPAAGPEQRLTVVEFRERLVEALTVPEPPVPAPSKPQISELENDAEALQRLIGLRLLLLAPIYGYGLNELVTEGDTMSLAVDYEGRSEKYEIDELRTRLQEHIRDDLARGVQRDGGTAIDLNRVAEAETAAAADDWSQVVELLGSWPMPLAIYWRTPEGQMLPEHARQRIAEGLGLLGTACCKLGDDAQGEEVLRLAVQYAQDGEAAARIYLRLAQGFLDADRFGEAVGLLRRAEALGSGAEEVLPELANALFECNRSVAAYGCLRRAKAAGVTASKLKAVRKKLNKRLGAKLKHWEQFVEV